jgi:hypothetical protein
MEDLLSYNEGLPSRFPSQFTFADYSDDELLAILKVGEVPTLAGCYPVYQDAGMVPQWSVAILHGEPLVSLCMFGCLQGIIDNEKPRLTLEDDKYARIAARRLGRQRGTVGFGNARAVDAT